MATKSFHVRLDPKQKKKAEKILRNLGLDMPTAVRIFFAKVVDSGGIPFAVIEEQDRYSPEMLAKIDRLVEEAEQGKGVSGPFYTAEDLIKHLRG